MTSTMTVTVPTENSGELAYFKIEFLKEKFEEVVEMVGLLVKPSDVELAAKMGIWKVIG